MSANAVTLPYRPRPHFLDFHRRTTRLALIVAHRRCGKTEACLGELVERALRTRKPNARFAYIGPFAAQAADVAWERLKRLLPPPLLARCTIRESNHKIVLPNGASIQIYGADNYESLRGLYLDGVILDEVADMHPDAWPLVIAPTLMDRKGWAVFIGTPKGTTNFFYQQREKARKNVGGDWFYLNLPNSTTGYLNDEALRLLRDELDEDEFQQEVECSFDAAVKGTYYAKTLSIMESEGQLKAFDFVKSAPVHAAFDLGYEDSTACWFYQVINGRLDVLDHWSANHLSIAEIAEEVMARYRTMGYRVGDWWLPHDAEHKSVQTGKTIVELLVKEGVQRSKLRKVPNEKVYQGIQAVRATLPKMRIHGVNCYDGLEALKAYRKKENSKLGTFSREPLHDWSSHSADAMRYLCLAVRDEDITTSAQQTAAAPTSEESFIAWEAKRTINKASAATGYALNDIWDTGPQRGGYLRI